MSRSERVSSESLAYSVSIVAAKQQMLWNVLSNFLLIGLNAIVSVLLAPYLVRNMGVAAYGMIALANSFPAYIRLVSVSAADTVLRYVSVNVSKNNLTGANLYYNTAVKAVLILNAIFVPLTILFAIGFPRIFNVPPELESQCVVLIVLVLFAAMVATTSSVSMVVFPLFHKSRLQNIVTSACRLFGIGVMIACFYVYGIRLEFVGAYYLSSALSAFLLLFALQLRFRSPLRIERKKFHFKALRELSSLGIWVLIDQVATLIYLSAGFAVVNITLGAEATGRFGPIMLVNSLLMMLANAVATVLVPIFYNLIGQEDQTALPDQLVRATKLLCLITGLPVVILCGFSESIFAIWLGPQFDHLSSLLWMVMFSTWGAVCYGPVCQIFRGMNRAAVPAAISLLCGIAHLALMIVLIRYYDWGLNAFGVSFTLFVGIRAVVISSWYAGVLLNCNAWKFLRPTTAIFLLILSCAVVGRTLSVNVVLDYWLYCAAAALLLSVVYASLGAGIILTSADRRAIMALWFNRSNDRGLKRTNPE